MVHYLYSPENYYARVRTFLGEYRPMKIDIPINFENILAFLKSIIRLGIFGKERLQYWKLFLWTLFRRPKLFPLAITLSIYGYHFRQVCELHVR